MFAITLAEHANEPVDVLRVLKMLLIHDLVEIDAGDTLWRFEGSFLESNWTCIWGRGCSGILPRPAEELVGLLREGRGRGVLVRHRDPHDVGAGADEIQGQAGNDLLHAGAGDDQIRAGRGRDLVLGKGGSDWLKGDRGKDEVRGNGDNDYLWGGYGRDLLRGGAGRDWCNSHHTDRRWSCERG